MAFWATSRAARSDVRMAPMVRSAATMAGASLGGMSGMHEQGGLPIPGITHIEQPYWFECGGELSPAELEAFIEKTKL